MTGGRVGREHDEDDVDGLENKMLQSVQEFAQESNRHVVSRDRPVHARDCWDWAAPVMTGIRRYYSSVGMPHPAHWRAPDSADLLCSRPTAMDLPHTSTYLRGVLDMYLH